MTTCETQKDRPMFIRLFDFSCGKWMKRLLSLPIRITVEDVCITKKEKKSAITSRNQIQLTWAYSVCLVLLNICLLLPIFIIDIFCDGTFKNCPKFFKRLYSIHGFQNGNYIVDGPIVILDGLYQHTTYYPWAVSGERSAELRGI